MAEDIKQFFKGIREVILSTRRMAARGVNTLQVAMNFEIGRRIFEHEQKGKKRAGYGERILRALSHELTSEFGKGFSKSNLEYMRRFFIEYKNRMPGIAQTVSGQLHVRTKIAQTASGQFGMPLTNAQTLYAQSGLPFKLSWSHYVFLMEINDLDERNFYEIETAQNDWSLRELKRQFDSSLYERLALSRNKKKIRELSKKGLIIERPEDMLKEPLVLDFLDFKEDASYSERDIETAIIDKMGLFLLEFGKGFLFEARQKRFTFGSDHFFIDLVFYNRILRCYVLVDLKIGKLTHQDLGQMQMYVNYFDRHVRINNENPTIGIILCKTKNDAMVELTLPKDTNVYPKQYQLYLPSKEEMKRKLKEWTR